MHLHGTGQASGLALPGSSALRGFLYSFLGGHSITRVIGLCPIRCGRLREMRAPAGDAGASGRCGHQHEMRALERHMCKLLEQSNQTRSLPTHFAFSLTAHPASKCAHLLQLLDPLNALFKEGPTLR
jgi:hypothetical protein